MNRSKDKCAFVRKHCLEERVGLLDYLDLYYCRFGSTKGVPFLILASWLGILFSTIGIAASDFFCINLSTIAAILGMSESMAGVTFLAFGNGSPDVFSTFAAMKINSGSLAIGELIGAACFITAVVAGSMAIVRPFKVGRKSFIRDVSFFAVAVLFSLYFLADGRIKMWECVLMIVFYLLYVVFVIGWHWMAGRKKRRRRKERRAREHYTAPEEEDLLVEEDDEDGGVGQGAQENGDLHDFRALESGLGRDLDDDDEDEEEREEREYAELSNNVRNSRPGMERRLTAATTHTIRPSLVGALEFRAVLSSLEKTKNLRGRQIHLRRYSDDPMLSGHSLSEPNPERPNLGGPVDATDPRHTPHSLLRPSTGPLGRLRAVSVNDAAQAVVDVGNLHSRIPDLLVQESDDGGSASEQENQPHVFAIKRPPGMRIYTSQFLAPPSSTGTSPAHSPPGSAPPSPLSKVAPRFSILDSDVDSDVITDSPGPIGGRPSPPPSLRLPRSSMDSSLTALSIPVQQAKRMKYWPYSLFPSPQRLYVTFFPTLQDFTDKTFLEKVFALVAVPSVFFLTLTLPVVEGPERPSADDGKPGGGQHNALPPESPSSFLTTTTIATPMVTPSDPPPPPKDWNRWLVAIQCITAPLFIVLVLFADSDTPLLKPILYALLTGLVCLALLLTLTTPMQPPRFRYLLCFGGFIVAISWISTIAEEVVGILKAFGVIFGISDAILGLTIFAVGNSLGDLVADITIARLGFPVMALSACFGGPMLNILLGIGVSGLYMTIIKGDPVYHIEVSSTLVISAATLLLTLVVLLVWVPLNNWMMSRRIGITLISIWTVGTAINVAVEVTGVGTKWGGQVARGG